jgi:hypothetical protein
MQKILANLACRIARGMTMAGYSTLGLFAACVIVAPISAALAQAPATQSGFDGRYTGTKTFTSGSGSGCPSTAVLEMTVRGPQVSIRDQFCATPFAGTVDAAGGVSASGTCENVGVTVSGTISNKSFSGQLAAGHYCFFKAICDLTNPI